MPILNEIYTLANGVQVPKLGLGTWFISDKDAAEAVRQAVKLGYRHIDTAEAYANEAGVGEGIRTCGVPREQIFVNSKVIAEAKTYDDAMKQIDDSISKMNIGYIDMMIIHSPQPWSQWRKAKNRYFAENIEVWRAMEDAYKEGKLRAIGVSNFYPDRLVDICSFNEIKPAVNQIETHPFFQRVEDRKYLKKYGVAHESWGPFAEGRNGLFTNLVLKEVGLKYGKSIGQVVLRFLIQSDVIVIPKSTHKERMIENLNVFDFNLDDDDMQQIRSLDTGKSLFFDHRTPETVEIFLQWIK